MNIAGVLMAGGLGTRLWPSSRRDRPKQFLPLLSERSLVRMTLDRILPLVPADQILVLTNAHLVELAQEQLEEIPNENLIGEPRPCNTAPCIALAASLCEARWGPETVMLVMAADHYLGNEQKARETFRSACQAAHERKCLITIGITPTRPDTGYGYLECDRKITEIPVGKSTPLSGFREKPDYETACRYLEDGRHLWNMGNFAWRCDVILAEFEIHMPELISLAREAVRRKSEKALTDFYQNLPKDFCRSIDRGIMEKAERIEALPCLSPWDDVGSWAVLRRLRKDELDEGGNLSLGNHLAIETKNTLVAGEKDEDSLIVTVGVDGLIIVKDGDRLLVASEDNIELMREVVNEIRERGWRRHL